MNDAHDNAATDKAILKQAETDIAVEAFRKLELKKLQVELAEHALAKALANHRNVDMTHYYEVTEQIRHRAELQRAEHARRGRLPKETNVPALRAGAAAALGQLERPPYAGWLATTSGLGPRRST